LIFLSLYTRYEMNNQTDEYTPRMHQHARTAHSMRVSPKRKRKREKKRE